MLFALVLHPLSRWYLTTFDITSPLLHLAARKGLPSSHTFIIVLLLWWSLWFSDHIDIASVSAFIVNHCHRHWLWSCGWWLMVVSSGGDCWGGGGCRFLLLLLLGGCSCSLSLSLLVMVVDKGWELHGSCGCLFPTSTVGVMYCLTISKWLCLASLPGKHVTSVAAVT